MLQFLLPLISLIGGQIAGSRAKSSAEAKAGGATMQNMVPLMMQLMQQQQGQSAQNFGLQTQRYQANLPIQDALRSMALGMLPGQYTRGLPTPTPISQQPMPPAPAPVTLPTLPKAKKPTSGFGNWRKEDK